MPRSDSARTTKGLRTIIDVRDPYLSGHQIHAISRPERQIPDWMNSDEQVRAFLLRVFPKLAESSRQRASAGRWLRVIHLYFRGSYNASEVAEEIGISYRAVKSLVRSIRRVSMGLAANGSGPRKR